MVLGDNGWLPAASYPCCFGLKVRDASSLQTMAELAHFNVVKHFLNKKEAQQTRISSQSGQPGGQTPADHLCSHTSLLTLLLLFNQSLVFSPDLQPQGCSQQQGSG